MYAADFVSLDDGTGIVHTAVMYGVLVGLSKLLAPFMPFMSEEMYRNLTDDVSVHLTDFPKGDASLLDKQLIADMQIVRLVVEKGHFRSVFKILTELVIIPTN